MSHARVVISTDNQRLGFVVCNLAEPSSLAKGSIRDSYVVIWKDEFKPVPVVEQNNVYIAGSVRLANELGLSSWQEWAIENPELLLLEIIAEYAFLKNGDTASLSNIEIVRIKSRWNKLLEGLIGVEGFEQTLSTLRDKDIVVGSDKKITVKSLPTTIFVQPIDLTWWNRDDVEDKRKIIDIGQTLFTPKFLELFNHIDEVARSKNTLAELIALALFAESALGELGIERDGSSAKSIKFVHFLEHLPKEKRDVFANILALVWGDLEKSRLDIIESAFHLRSVSPAEIVKYRTLSTLLANAFTINLTDHLPDLDVLYLVLLAVETGTATNFKTSIERNLENIKIDAWRNIQREKPREFSQIMEFLTFASEVAKSLMSSLILETDGAFANSAFWAPLKEEKITAATIANLSKPLASELVRAYVIENLRGSLARANFLELATAFSDRTVHKYFEPENWSDWIAKALEAEESSGASKVLAKLTNIEMIQELTTVNAAMDAELAYLKAQVTEQKSLLETRLREFENVEQQLKQTRQGIQGVISTKSNQQESAILQAIAKILATAGSLPEKVDAAVFKQIVAQVKAIGILQFGNVGEQVSFDPRLHNFRGSDIQVGEKVSVLIPGFEYHGRDVPQVIWKAHVTRI